MAGVDYVLAHFSIDSTRMALMGYSYGGEMAGFVEGKTDSFKAVISGALLSTSSANTAPREARGTTAGTTANRGST